MPLSALPDHLKDVENHFPDDEQFGTSTWFGRTYRWLNKKTKTWFAFSYRCTEWWARWRIAPEVLFKIGGKGDWRYEWIYEPPAFPIRYLSRIQYHKTWSFIIHWPLMVCGHIYIKGKPLYFYWNHYDADNVYWMFTSLFIGRTWK